MVDQIQVLIADDHRLFREGLRLILAREEKIAVVGEASGGQKTVELAGRLKPDVALLDITMPLMSGIEVILPIRQISPKTKPLTQAPVISSKLFAQCTRAICGLSGS
jgi:DNA-binding NarL/FixJ family response regulator